MAKKTKTAPKKPTTKRKDSKKPSTSKANASA